MDIQLASNFERYLYYLIDGSQHQLKEMMTEFSCSGKLVINPDFLKR